MQILRQNLLDERDSHHKWMKQGWSPANYVPYSHVIKVFDFFAEMHADVFADTRYHMSSTSQVFNGVKIDAVPSYTGGYIRFGNVKHTDQNYIRAANDLAQGHREELSRLNLQNLTIYPFLPVTALGITLDVTTMQPQMLMHTLYGVGPIL